MRRRMVIRTAKPGPQHIWTTITKVFESTTDKSQTEIVLSTLILQRPFRTTYPKCSKTRLMSFHRLSLHSRLGRGCSIIIESPTQSRPDEASAFSRHRSSPGPTEPPLTCRGSPGVPPYHCTSAFHRLSGTSSKSRPRTRVTSVRRRPPSPVRFVT